jgi:hypothetical protein
VPNLRTLLSEEFLNLISTNATRQIYQKLRTEFLTSVFVGTIISHIYQIVISNAERSSNTTCQYVISSNMISKVDHAFYTINMNDILSDLKLFSLNVL